MTDNIMIRKVRVFLILTIFFVSGCLGSDSERSDLMTDLSKIKIYPNNGSYFPGTKMSLMDYSLNYTARTEDVCTIDNTEPGDLGILVEGTIKNEYDKDYWISIDAQAYDFDGNSIKHSTILPWCTARYIENNNIEVFKIHLKYNNEISRINIDISVSDFPPP